MKNLSKEEGFRGLAKAHFVAPMMLLLLACVPLLAGGRKPVEAAAEAPGLAAGGPVATGGYRILDPIHSGALTIFPVIGGESERAAHWNYMTLDEGLRSGDVEITEAGKLRGLVRPRRPGTALPASSYDQVNTLVLVNHSARPLVLLAGEIVTGGKQDRVIAKDRIVPPGAEPLDLGVFCIEHGRWTESSATFGPTAAKAEKSFMAQPSVRREAMSTQEQTAVWASVGASINGLAAAAAPVAVADGRRTATSSGGVFQPNEPASQGRMLGTTSYAKALQDKSISQKVDETDGRAEANVLAQLQKVHATGVVVAVRGEIVWADVFATNDLLNKYWPKLMRSYVAEALTAREWHTRPAGLGDAEHFMTTAGSSGRETSEGEHGIYRYSEVKSPTVDSFVLEALLPGTGFDVHTSKIRLAEWNGYARPGVIAR